MIAAQLDSSAALALGLLLACVGYRIYRISLRMAGFLLGFLAGTALGAGLSQLLGTARYDLPLTAGLGLVLGLAGTVLIRKAVRLLLFVSGVLLGLLGHHLVQAGGLELSRGAGGVTGILTGLDLAALLVALAAGLAAILLERWFVIALTAVWGALLVASALGHPAYFYGVVLAGVAIQVWPRRSGEKDG